MRPIGGVETKITHVAVKYANTPTPELRRIMKGADRITRSGIKRVLRVRGELEEKKALDAEIGRTFVANGSGALQRHG